MATKKKQPTPGIPVAPSMPSKAQEKAMGELMALVTGGFKREDEVKAKDVAGNSQPPAIRPSPSEPKQSDTKEVQVPVVQQDVQVPAVSQETAGISVIQEPREYIEPRNPSALGIQRPLGLDVPLQRRAIVTPKAKEKAMSATGSGWTKIGWYIQESTKAAADVEIRRLQTTGSEFLDLAVRHYISGLQMAGQDPEILLDEAGYLMQDVLKQGVTDELRVRIEALLQQLND